MTDVRCATLKSRVFRDESKRIKSKSQIRKRNNEDVKNRQIRVVTRVFLGETKSVKVVNVIESKKFWSEVNTRVQR